MKYKLFFFYKTLIVSSVIRCKPLSIVMKKSHLIVAVAVAVAVVTVAVILVCRNKKRRSAKRVVAKMSLQNRPDILSTEFVKEITLVANGFGKIVESALYDLPLEIGSCSNIKLKDGINLKKCGVVKPVKGSFAPGPKWINQAEYDLCYGGCMTAPWVAARWTCCKLPGPLDCGDCPTTKCRHSCTGGIIGWELDIDRVDDLEFLFDFGNFKFEITGSKTRNVKFGTSIQIDPTITVTGAYSGLLGMFGLPDHATIKVGLTRAVFELNMSGGLYCLDGSTYFEDIKVSSYKLTHKGLKLKSGLSQADMMFDPLMKSLTPLAEDGINAAAKGVVQIIKNELKKFNYKDHVINVSC